MPTFQEIADRIDAFMREAIASGKTDGFSIAELAEGCKFGKPEVGKTLRAGGRFVKIRRLNSFFWYPMDAAPFPIANLSKDEILARVEANEQRHPFAEVLRQVMGSRTTSRTPILALFTNADVHDFRMAYGLVGPLPTVAEAQRKVAQVQAVLDSTKAAAVAKPAGGFEPDAADDTGTSIGSAINAWPFKINRQEADEQIRDGQNRRASLDDERDWVKMNLANPFATPASAPSNYAWQRLRQALTNPVQEAKFHEEVARAERDRKKKQEAVKKREDDGRRMFKLFDMVEREFGRQDSEKENAGAA